MCGGKILLSERSGSSRATRAAASAAPARAAAAFTAASSLASSSATVKRGGFLACAPGQARLISQLLDSQQTSHSKKRGWGKARSNFFSLTRISLTRRRGADCRGQHGAARARAGGCSTPRTPIRRRPTDHRHHLLSTYIQLYSVLSILSIALSLCVYCCWLLSPIFSGVV